MTLLDGTVRQTEGGGFIVAFDRSYDRPPDKVWAALTDPKVLANWLGDVELEPRVGGPYIIRFRRLSVVMTGTITALEAGRVLEYTWRENYGMPQSVIRWELSPTPAGCRLKLSHTFPSNCVLSEVVSFLGGWHAFLNAIPRAAAGDYVEYADEKDFDAGYRARYITEPEREQNATFLKQPGVRMERLLPGPIERVWAHLTDPKLLPAWFGDQSTLEPRQGGAVNLMGGHVRGTVTQWHPPRQLACTWNVFGPNDPADAISQYPESYLTIRLQKEGEKVLLILTHVPVLEAFEQRNAMGWHTFLDILGDTLASRPVRTREEYMVRNSARYGVDLGNTRG